MTFGFPGCHYSKHPGYRLCHFASKPETRSRVWWGGGLELRGFGFRVWVPGFGEVKCLKFLSLVGLGYKPKPNTPSPAGCAVQHALNYPLQGVVGSRGLEFGASDFGFPGEVAGTVPRMFGKKATRPPAQRSQVSM